MKQLKLSYPGWEEKRRLIFLVQKSPFPNFITWGGRRGGKGHKSKATYSNLIKLLFNLRFTIESFSPIKHFLEVTGSGSSNWSYSDMLIVVLHKQRKVAIIHPFPKSLNS